MKFGIQIADALEKAHGQGITNRDLKPGNVMLTKGGAKLLDFGLARLSGQTVPVSPALADLVTMDRKLTEEGVILGTFQYMAPEQLEGKNSDARSDVFALGAMLYEMSAGRPAFRGNTKASLIAAILSSEPPPISTLQPLMPRALDRLVNSCLRKDPDERPQTAHDVKLQLQWIKDGGLEAGVAPPIAARQKTRDFVGIAWATAVALLLVLAASTVVIRYLRPAPPPQRKLMFAVDLPPGYRLSEDGTSALSPDGASIAYAATDLKGKASLWVRSLDSLTPRRLEGSDGD